MFLGTSHQYAERLAAQLEWAEEEQLANAIENLIIDDIFTDRIQRRDTIRLSIDGSIIGMEF